MRHSWLKSLLMITTITVSTVIMLGEAATAITCFSVNVDDTVKFFQINPHNGYINLVFDRSAATPFMISDDGYLFHDTDKYMGTNNDIDDYSVISSMSKNACSYTICQTWYLAAALLQWDDPGFASGGGEADFYTNGIDVLVPVQGSLPDGFVYIIPSSFRCAGTSTTTTTTTISTTSNIPTTTIPNTAITSSVTTTDSTTITTSSSTTVSTTTPVGPACTNYPGDPSVTSVYCNSQQGSFAKQGHLWSIHCGQAAVANTIDNPNSYETFIDCLDDCAVDSDCTAAQFDYQTSICVWYTGSVTFFDLGYAALATTEQWIAAINADCYQAVTISSSITTTDISSTSSFEITTTSNTATTSSGTVLGSTTTASTTTDTTTRSPVTTSTISTSLTTTFTTSAGLPSCTDFDSVPTSCNLPGDFNAYNDEEFTVDGKVFVLNCAHVIGGSPIGPDRSANSLTECVQFCAELDDCYGASYTANDHNCQLLPLGGIVMYYPGFGETVAAIFVSECQLGSSSGTSSTTSSISSSIASSTDSGNPTSTTSMESITTSSIMLPTTMTTESTPSTLRLAIELDTTTSFASSSTEITATSSATASTISPDPLTASSPSSSSTVRSIIINFSVTSSTITDPTHISSTESSPSSIGSIDTTSTTLGPTTTSLNTGMIAVSSTLSSLVTDPTTLSLTSTDSYTIDSVSVSSITASLTSVDLTPILLTPVLLTPTSFTSTSSTMESMTTSSATVSLTTTTLTSISSSITSSTPTSSLLSATTTSSDTELTIRNSVTLSTGSTTTAVSSITLTASTADLCPVPSGTISQDFQVDCGYAIDDPSTNGLARRQAPYNVDFQTCINLCAADTLCSSISFIESSSTCYLYQNGNTRLVPRVGWRAAIRISAVTTSPTIQLSTTSEVIATISSGSSTATSTSTPTPDPSTSSLLSILDATTVSTSVASSTTPLSSSSQFTTTASLTSPSSDPASSTPTSRNSSLSTSSSSTSTPDISAVAIIASVVLPPGFSTSSSPILGVSTTGSAATSITDTSSSTITSSTTTTPIDPQTSMTIASSVSTITTLVSTSTTTGAFYTNSSASRSIGSSTDSVTTTFVSSRIDIFGDTGTSSRASTVNNPGTTESGSSTTDFTQTATSTLENAGIVSASVFSTISTMPTPPVMLSPFSVTTSILTTTTSDSITTKVSGDARSTNTPNYISTSQKVLGSIDPASTSTLSTILTASKSPDEIELLSSVMFSTILTSITSTTDTVQMSISSTRSPRTASSLSLSLQSGTAVTTISKTRSGNLPPSHSFTAVLSTTVGTGYTLRNSASTRTSSGLTDHRPDPSSSGTSSGSNTGSVQRSGEWQKWKSTPSGKAYGATTTDPATHNNEWGSWVLTKSGTYADSTIDSTSGESSRKGQASTTNGLTLTAAPTKLTPQSDRTWSDWRSADSVVSVTITLSTTFVVPCAFGWRTSTFTLTTLHCGCTETPIPNAIRITTYTTTCPSNWGLGTDAIVLTIPVPTASSTSISSTGEGQHSNAATGDSGSNSYYSAISYTAKASPSLPNHKAGTTSTVHQSVFSWDPRNSSADTSTTLRPSTEVVTTTMAGNKAIESALAAPWDSWKASTESSATWVTSKVAGSPTIGVSSANVATTTRVKETSTQRVSVTITPWTGAASRSFSTVPEVTLIIIGMLMALVL